MGNQPDDRDVDVLRRAYGAFNAREIDVAIELTHPEVNWANGWEGGRVLGRPAVRDYWTRQFSAISSEVEPEAFTEEQDGTITVDVHQVVREAGTGELISDSHVRHRYRLEDGLVIRMDVIEAETAVHIETQRLCLRPIELGDLDDFVALHADPEVTQFIRPLDRAAAEERLHRDASEWLQRGHGLLAVLARSSGAFLGRCGLKYWPQFDETELGWALRRDAWGQGYATEAARACIEWGFSEFEMQYLTAMINRGNVRSIRVADRLGLTPLRDDVLLGDPVVVYGLDRPPSAPSRSPST